jgi:hypothetical protein
VRTMHISSRDNLQVESSNSGTPRCFGPSVERRDAFGRMSLVADNAAAICFGQRLR